ncbi:hypothetical protein JKF63_04773 [Porcisia hertigi]|uniref:Uncharacterized protein n=1 Tax=Porcisia hertigi TaxID=2761500 RepID=A0A836IVA9_9TRYP|nr:hypothetical protein JKF63_04773 [Porcisia hertigi]
MQPSATAELQRLWLDARCTPPGAAQHSDKVNTLLSVFVTTFTSRSSPAFRLLFGDGAALVRLLCRDFAALARQLTREDATLAPASAALGTVQLFAQALRFLINDDTIPSNEVWQLASAYESFGSFNVVALSIVLHDRLLHAIRTQEKTADGAEVSETDLLLLQLVSTVMACKHTELTRRSLLEAVLPERVTSISATAMTYFSAPERAGVEAAKESSSILHHQLRNVVHEETVVEVLRAMEGALVSSQRRHSGVAAAVWSLSCFAYTLDDIIYAKQIIGFSPVESVNFDVITATVLNFERETGEEGMPALRRVVESLRVLALAERCVESSRPSAKSSLLGSSLLRMLPASVGKIQQRIADSWGVADRPETPPRVRCDKAVDALARLFVLSTTIPMSELCGEQLFELLSMTGVTSELLAFVLSICAVSMPRFEASKMRSLMDFIGTLPYQKDVADFLQTLLDHLRSGRLCLPEQRLTVVDFFTDWCPKTTTHAALSVTLDFVETCVDCMVQLAVDPRTGELETFVEHFSVLVKVVLMSSETAESVLNHDCCLSLLQVMLSALDSGQPHTAVLLRDVFVGVVLKTNILCDVLLELIASATDAEMWTSVATPLFSTLVLFLHSCGRHNRASFPHNCIELCLSLTQHLERSSRNPAVDRHLLGCCLSLVLTLVNYSDVWDLVARTLGTLPVSCDHVQTLMDLCTGVLRSSDSLAIAERYFTEPVVSKERWSAPCFLHFGPFAVMEEPCVEMLYPVKLLVRMVDTMLKERHADASSAMEAMEHLMLHSGVTVPSSYIADFVAGWDHFTWIRCTSNVCNKKLLPLFFARASTIAAVQKAQRVWLEGLSAHSDGERDVRHYPDYIFFGEGGGARGLVTCSGVTWPPLDAYCTAMWVYIDPVSLSNRYEGRVVLWQLEWDAMGRHVCLSLAVHTQRKCCLYLCDIGGDVTVVELPALPEQRWVHVATSHARGRMSVSQLKMYLNGVEVALKGCPYPSGGLEVAASVAAPFPSMQSRDLVVTIGSPEDTPGNLATLRFISFQLYGCGVSQSQIASLYAMGPYPSNQVWDSAGQQVYDFHAPFLPEEVVRSVEASLHSASLESILREQHVVLFYPPTLRLIDVHVFAMAQVNSVFGYWNNKQWVLRNIAAPAMSELYLHGYYRPPRDSRTNSMTALLCNGAHWEWMRWMRCIAAGVLDAEHVRDFATETNNDTVSEEETGGSLAAVQQTAYQMLRVMSFMSGQTGLLPRSQHRFMAQFAEHVAYHPQVYLHNPTAVTELLGLCLQTVRYRDQHGHAVHGQLLWNLLPLEHIFFNWRLLSNLSADTWITAMETLQQLVSLSNPLAGLNAARFLAADFVNGFVFGLLREYVPFPRLAMAIELVKCVLLTSYGRDELMERVLMAALMTLPGPSQCGPSLTMESFLGSKLPSTSFVYLVLVRNMLLRCLNEVLEMTLNDGTDAFLSTFVSVVPDWWFTTMLSGNSHPVSVALTLRLFVMCFLNSKRFREACSVTKAECISRAMEPHCHQRELMDILVQGYMGRLWVISSSNSGYTTAGWSGKTEMQGLLTVILHVLKSQCQLLLRATPVTSEEVTVRGYFSSASVEVTGTLAENISLAASRWRRLRLVLAALRRMRKAIGDEKGVKVGASVASSLAVAQYTAPVAALKNLVCEVVHWLAKTYPISMSLGKSLYQSNKAANLIDLLMWPVLVALSPKEHVAMQPGVNVDALGRGVREDDGATLSVSGASTDADADEEEWEVLPEPTTYEARSFGLDLMGPSEEMESVYNACKTLFFTHATSMVSSTDFVATASGGITMSRYVLALHRALSAEVTGVGNRAEDARKAFLSFVWLKASEHAIECACDGSTAAVKRNTIELGKYVLQRLVSGGAVPPAAVGFFYQFLLTRWKCNAEVVKVARTALFEWFVYVTSASFYRLDASKVGVVVDMAYSCADTLFSSPMPGIKLLRVVVGRLFQVTLCVWGSTDDDGHPSIHKMVMLWEAVLLANQKNALMSSLFVCASPAVDAFHGGFDLLLPPIASPEAFAVWIRQHLADVGQLLQSFMGLSYEFVMARPDEHLRLSRRYTTACLTEWGRRGRHVAAMVAAHWKLWEGTFLTTTFVDPALLASPASRYPYFSVINGCGAVGDAEGTLCSEWSMEDNGAVSRCCRHVSENVDEVTSDPLSFYIRYAPPACLPLQQQEARDPAGTLRPNAHAVIAKVAGHGAGGSVVFVSNAYLVLGTESYISTCVLTRQELIIISCSAVTPSGDFFAEKVRVHTASQRSYAKSSRLQQAFRLFLSGDDKGSGSTSSQAAFRYSQYYRQLRTESAKGSNALVWRFPLGSITSVHQRLFQHLSAGLEVVLESGKCVFLVLLDGELSFSKACRDRLFACFESNTDPLLSGIAAYSFNEKLARLSIWTRRWVRRECSNYMYLRVLNDAASRTTSNLGQYPVMPWVLSRYTENTLNLEDASAYRDLSKPVGALNEVNARQLRERYMDWIASDPVADSPYHHGTHYSTAAIVLYYLIRLQPFTSRAIRFQGGRLDIADRLFHSVAEAWANGRGLSRGDVKELIPQFFRVSEFLENRNQVPLGTRSDGVVLDDVELPPWCGGSAATFVYMNALSLESEIVSRHLHRWIDLIFGCKQVGQGAVEALNVFSPLSYKEGVDRAINNAATEEERKSIVASVDNFGQTPLQLFSKEAHAARRDAQQVRSTQAYMVAAAADVTTQPCRCAQVVGRAEGGISAALFADDTCFMCDEVSTAVLAKAVHLLSYDRDMDCIICTAARGHRVLATIQPVLSSGTGGVRCLCASARGSIVCVGTDSGKVIVYSRESTQIRFSLVAVLDCVAAVLREAGPVSSLHLLEEGNLLVAYEKESAVSGWRLSVLSTTFTFATSFSTQVDSTPVKAISFDSHTGLYYAAKAKSIVIFSAAGVMLTQLNMVALLMSAAPDYSTRMVNSCITALLFANCSSFAFTNIILLGHSNGTVSLWSVVASQTVSGDSPPPQAPLWSFQFLHDVVFDAPVACLVASAGELSFVAVLANRTAHYIRFPESEHEGF